MSRYAMPLPNDQSARSLISEPDARRRQRQRAVRGPHSGNRSGPGAWVPPQTQAPRGWSRPPLGGDAARALATVPGDNRVSQWLLGWSPAESVDGDETKPGRGEDGYREAGPGHRCLTGG